MTARQKSETPKRRYRHPKALTGIREPVRDLHNFADVDRACERWLLKNDPTYRRGSISSTFIDFD